MIVFTIIGVLFVLGLILQLIAKNLKSVDTTPCLNKNEVSKFKKDESLSEPITLKEFGYRSDNEIFNAYVDAARTSLPHLGTQKINESGLEIIILMACYTSYIFNSLYPDASEKIDTDIRLEIYKYIDHFNLGNIIEDEFYTTDNFIRSRLGLATDDIRMMQESFIFQNDQPSTGTYQAIVINPLRKNNDSDNYAISGHFSIFIKVRKALFLGFVEILNRILLKEYKVPIKMPINFDNLDFSYNPLFEDCCINCERFYSRDIMVRDEFINYDFGRIIYGKSCIMCLVKHSHEEKRSKHRKLNDLTYVDDDKFIEVCFVNGVKARLSTDYHDCISDDDSLSDQYTVDLVNEILCVLSHDDKLLFDNLRLFIGLDGKFIRTTTSSYYNGETIEELPF